MRISVFGLGYVGSVSAVCLAHKGYQVIGVDVQQKKVDIINNGHAIIIEPQLNELTALAVQNKKLRATLNIADAILNSDISFICVATPSNEDGIDLQYIQRISEDIGRVLKDKPEHHIIVCRSTMFPGCTRNIIIKTLELYSDRQEGKDFSVCFSPEFMREGTAVDDYYNPPKNVIGTSNQYVRNLLGELNTLCTNMPTIFVEIEEAEFIKYADNIWHALKVGFANEIGNVCKALTIDSHKIMEVFCQDQKLNLSAYYLTPGFAFGGSCLPKDLRAFLYESTRLNLQLPIISAILPSNTLQIERALEMVLTHAHTQIGILGCSFKAHTDDLRESPTLALIEILLAKGYDVKIFDTNVHSAKLTGANLSLNNLPHVAKLLVNNIAELLEHAQIIIIGNKSPEFANVIQMVNVDQVVIDLVRIQPSLSTTTNYHGICW